MDHYNLQKLQLIAATCEVLWPTVEFFFHHKKHLPSFFFLFHKDKKNCHLISFSYMFPDCVLGFYNFNWNLKLLLIWLQPNLHALPLCVRRRKKRILLLKITDASGREFWREGEIHNGNLGCSWRAPRTLQTWSMICFLVHIQWPLSCHAITSLS